MKAWKVRHAELGVLAAYPPTSVGKAEAEAELSHLVAEHGYDAGELSLDKAEDIEPEGG